MCEHTLSQKALAPGRRGGPEAEGGKRHGNGGDGVVRLGECSLRTSKDKAGGGGWFSSLLLRVFLVVKQFPILIL